MGNVYIIHAPYYCTLFTVYCKVYNTPVVGVILNPNFLSFPETFRAKVGMTQYNQIILTISSCRVSVYRFN